MNIHNNARLTPIGRERNRHAGRKRTDAAGHRTSRRRLSAHCPQMGGALCRRGRRRFAGPVLAAEAAPSPNSASRHRPDRRTAPPASDRQGDCPEDRRLAGNRQPGLEAVGLEPPQRSRSARAGAALRARASGRTDPYRYQETRPLQAHWPSHHRGPHRPEQQRAASAGSSSMSVSTMPRASPSQGSCPTRRRSAPSRFSKPPSPITRASASKSRAS